MNDQIEYLKKKTKRPKDGAFFIISILQTATHQSSGWIRFGLSLGRLTESPRPRTIHWSPHWATAAVSSSQPGSHVLPCCTPHCPKTSPAGQVQLDASSKVPHLGRCSFRTFTAKNDRWGPLRPLHITSFKRQAVDCWLNLNQLVRHDRALPAA